MFIGICLYFIFLTHVRCKRKKAKSVTAKLSAGLGLNLLIALPAFLYLLSVGTAQIPYVLFFCSYFFSIVNGSFADLSICLLRLVFMDVPNDSFKKRLIISLFLGSGIRSEEVPPLFEESVR